MAMWQTSILNKPIRTIEANKNSTHCTRAKTHYCRDTRINTLKHCPMVWINFPIYASIAIIFWITAILLLLQNNQHKRTRYALVSAVVGVGVMLAFVANLWLILQRPPMRTLGETRLLYTLFLPIIALLTYKRWRFSWLLVYGLSMAILFLIVNLTHPEAYNKTLMPALRSPWFVPHVLVYIFAYAMLAASAIVAMKGLTDYYRDKMQANTLALADNIVYIGFAFLSAGLLFGALWAKEAWGHYWTWDPKETWAFITWLAYLAFIHLRLLMPTEQLRPMWLLSVAFLLLLFGWFGINYLPAAQTSVHTYGITN
jgi:ABC-type transport system involved in cytochrome c biogenesis permease subunit